MGARGEIIAPKRTRARQDKGITLLREGSSGTRGRGGRDVCQLQIGGCGAASASTPRWCRNMFEANKWTWMTLRGDSRILQYVVSS